ncbi:cytochrome P450 2U1-like isoform X1 [Biomphalaria glabrata]|nr:cytochrome P450 2U1-like isoform X1 [Biomphalaria glabrata]
MFETVLPYFETSAILAAVLLLLVTFYIRSRQPKTLPPSPGAALPLIGHLHLLGKNPRRRFKQWAQEYGDVFTLQMGPQRTIFVNTLEAMKEAFIKKADFFSDRSQNNIIGRHASNFFHGIISTSGPNWKAQRTTSLAILRNFGMGKNMLAEKILEEVSFYTKELGNSKGKPCDIHYLTNMSVSNVISSIIFGKRFEFNDPKFIKKIEIFNDLVKLSTGVIVLNFFPSLYYLPFDMFKGKKLIQLYFAMRDFTDEMISEVKMRHDSGNLDNYIVAYIEEMEKEKQVGQHFLDELNLARNIDNLFIAGSETTSTTIMWCLLYMLHYPEVQQKIYKEIVEQIGTDRPPNITDKSNLKYLTAVIMEVQRKASIVPLSLPHLCNKDTTLAGYNIPKGTIVMPNLDAIHASKEIWGDPENFRPERFLDAKGNIIKREELMPFSIGRRICLGESLAKMELFLYLSTLFQKFEFLPASPDKVPPLHDTWGLVAAPEPFEIRCVERAN